jgi:hypothetical protein
MSGTVPRADEEHDNCTLADGHQPRDPAQLHPRQAPCQVQYLELVRNRITVPLGDGHQPHDPAQLHLARLHVR